MSEDVPSAEDLIKMGLAKRIHRGSQGLIWISAEGHRLLGKKLRERSRKNGHPNAEEQRRIFRNIKAENREKGKQ